MVAQASQAAFAANFHAAARLVEDDFVAGVGRDPRAQLGRELGEVLVGQSEGEAEAAGFGDQPGPDGLHARSAAEP